MAVKVRLAQGNESLRLPLVPHEMRDDAELYPQIAGVLGGEDPLATMSAAHREIFRLAKRCTVWQKMFPMIAQTLAGCSKDSVCFTASTRSSACTVHRRTNCFIRLLTTLDETVVGARQIGHGARR